MRIFLTGASGFIGSALLPELLAAGHDVLALARSDAAAAALQAAGATPHRGDLADAGTLTAGAAAAEAVIHAGFIHDFSRFAESCETDRRAIAALGAGLAEGAPMLVTSGTALLAGAGMALESQGVPASSHNPRRASEEAAEALAAAGKRVAVVRLPPSVHGAGDHGFVPLLIRLAREKGLSAFAADGANLWPAVHRSDAARLFRLALDHTTPGARFHAVAERGIPFRLLAGAIAAGLGLPSAGLPAAEAAAHFGWFAHFAGLDNPADSAWTRERLGWQPDGPGLLQDLARAGYFDS
ncbi:3-beta hydroxysteroid dehydrogenase [Pseudoroseomonas deserti]|uniref:3-beta hydroxysteroid dehydrogenase n=1 Tax=Teichococcus deserti TaxID=1817963 RepID=A0A1V2GW00_9PROT|nr:NAD-dependent epimerase/dehydratase family protein [Pseudoroseomonas deserti]ONG47348.1 3-beta hydroxysteroid dehydrogenase [Pseudoroseomonas deserti]